MSETFVLCVVKEKQASKTKKEGIKTQKLLPFY